MHSFYDFILEVIARVAVLFISHKNKLNSPYCGGSARWRVCLTYVRPNLTSTDVFIWVAKIRAILRLNRTVEKVGNNWTLTILLIST